MTRYHWVLTMQRVTSTSIETRTTDGIVTPQPGTTRRGIFRAAMEDLTGKFPDLGNGGTVLFFSLDPDEL